ncbi:MAG: DUF447 family protein [Candidatus Caldarchaeum sp.]|nr:DUF447 family protein [Candidatus Caldarchaeum sp.]
MLFDFGFEPDLWYEVILTTYCEDRRPHAAPMGCSTSDGQLLRLKPFTNTTTFKNLKDRRYAVANISHDPALFYNALFKNDLDFVNAQQVDAPALRGCDGWVELEITRLTQIDEMRAEASGKVVNIVTFSTSLKPYSRAEHALVEALIHFTRVVVFANTTRHDEAVRLAEKIREYIELTKRVSRKPAHMTICEKLLCSLEEVMGGK